MRIGYSVSIISIGTFDWLAPICGTPFWPSWVAAPPQVPMKVSQNTKALPFW